MNEMNNIEESLRNYMINFSSGPENGLQTENGNSSSLKRFTSPSTIRESKQYQNSLRESYDLDIDNSLEELNNYGEMSELFKKKKYVVLKDNNKVPDYKVRKVMNEKLRYRPSAFNYQNSRNSDYKQLSPINGIKYNLPVNTAGAGSLNVDFTPD